MSPHISFWISARAAPTSIDIGATTHQLPGPFTPRSSAGRGDTEQPLRAWVHVVRAANWSNPIDVKRMFRGADVIGNERAIFDIGGNKYRLVVAIHYRGKRIYVRFIGTHGEYDKIDAKTV